MTSQPSEPIQKGKDFYTIDKNVPIPSGAPGVFAVLAERMEIGDSVLVKKDQAQRLIDQLKRFDRKGTSKAEGDKRRVWRIK